jgi:LacI family transcriptional regulator
VIFAGDRAVHRETARPILPCRQIPCHPVYHVTIRAQPAHITTTQIATKAGVSRTTVSFALRGNPKIPAVTANRVRAAAAELGHRPNPHVAAIMAHIRRSRAVPAGERIAFVWVHTPRSESANSSFLQHVFRGAKARAEALGYGLEQFWTAEPGMTERRLSQVITSRGIIGMLLSPLTHASEAKLDFDWSSFAPAVIGSARWTPELHHAGHHHYLAMRMTLERLTAAGFRRPMAILETEDNERARRAWEAAFAVFHPNRSAAAELLWSGLPKDGRAVARRIKACRPDALIVSAHWILDQLRAFKIALPPGMPVVSLYWLPTASDVGGIDQSYDLVAAHAVDLVVSQLNSNETGVPVWPRMLLFPGRWVDFTGDRSDGQTLNHAPSPLLRRGTAKSLSVQV